jgi:hypothetical protein
MKGKFRHILGIVEVVQCQVSLSHACRPLVLDCQSSGFLRFRSLQQHSILTFRAPQFLQRWPESWNLLRPAGAPIYAKEPKYSPWRFNYIFKTNLMGAPRILAKSGPSIDTLVARQWPSGHIPTDNGNCYEIFTDCMMPVLVIRSIILTKGRPGALIPVHFG